MSGLEESVCSELSNLSLKNDGYKAFLESIENIDERGFAENILESSLKNLTNTSKLHDLLDTQQNAVEDICNRKVLDLSAEDIKNIKLAIAGGGDPAEHFLNVLNSKNPSLAISSFQKALEEEGIPCNDSIRRNFSVCSTVSNLSYNCKKELCVPLNFDNKWQRFASRLGFKQGEIANMQLSQKRDNSYSPASRLFLAISNRKPEFSVKQFMDILKILKLNLIYQHMESMVREQAKIKVQSLTL